jgi:hypothetical protein
VAHERAKPILVRVQLGPVAFRGRVQGVCNATTADGEA